MITGRVIRECDACAYETECEDVHSQNPKDKPDTAFWFCDVCRQSLVRRTVEYSDVYVGQIAVLQTMAYLTNVILDAIKKR
jgi:hypothetical protein